MNRICKLCGKPKKLCASHILPKSFSKRMKAGSPQVVAIEMAKTPKATKSNGDHKEYLLCEECELHIKQEYEDYGTTYLHQRKNVIENTEYLIIPDFRYKQYYLFIISILWRASISSLPIYATTRHLRIIEPHLRRCIQEKTLLITNEGHKLDSFIKVSIARIIDTTNQITQPVLDRMMFSLNVEHGTNKEEGIHFYLMVDGFLITISVLLPKSPLASSWKTPGRLLDRSHLKIPKVCFTVIKPIFEAIAAIPATKDQLQ